MAVNVRSIVRPSVVDERTCLDADKCNTFLARCVTPGESILCEDDCMRGHGIVKQTNEGDGGQATRESAVYAALAGRVERINKLVSVTPIRSAYVPAVGDVVVGRVLEVVAHAHRWLVDIKATRNAVLPLASVNLPGNEVRRRGREDATLMRSLLREGDLLVAEVHSVHEDGQAFLHTRSERYGRLDASGRLLRVPISQVKRTKAHFHTLPMGGVQMLIGTNGLIWLSPPPDHLDLLLGPEQQSSGGDSFRASQGEPTSESYEPYAPSEIEGLGTSGNVAAERLALSAEARETIARAAVCIDLLARAGIALCDSTVLSAMECSARVGDASVRQFAVESRRADDLVRLVRERFVFERVSDDRFDAL